MHNYGIVLDWVEDQIRSGALSLGERLPSERTLAQELNISRGSVREALRVLAALGLVRSAVGSGPESGTILMSEPERGIGHILRLHLATATFSLTDISSTRIVLEQWNVQAVAELSSAERHHAGAQLTTTLQHLDTLLDSPEEFLRLDADFHAQIARLTNNPVMSILMSALRDGIQWYVTLIASQQSKWPQVASQLQAEHRELIAAIVAGKAEQAAALVSAHIRGYIEKIAPSSVNN